MDINNQVNYFPPGCPSCPTTCPPCPTSPTSCPNPTLSPAAQKALDWGLAMAGIVISCLAFWFCSWVVHQYVLVPSSMQDWNITDRVVQLAPNQSTRPPLLPLPVGPLGHRPVAESPPYPQPRPDGRRRGRDEACNLRPPQDASQPCAATREFRAGSHTTTKRGKQPHFYLPELQAQDTLGFSRPFLCLVCVVSSVSSHLCRSSVLSRLVCLVVSSRLRCVVTVCLPDKMLKLWSLVSF